MENRIERAIKLEESKIIKFLDITNDLNEIHRKGKKIVPGMYFALSFTNMIDSALKQFPELGYAGCEYTFKKISYLPSEINQILEINQEKKQFNIIAEQGGILMEGKIELAISINKNDKELEDIFKKQEICEKDFSGFCRTLNCEKTETSFKHFLLSFIPGVLVSNFSGDGGIYLKQKAYFNISEYKDAFNKHLKICTKQLNDKEIKKFRTAGAIAEKIVFDGYALAGR